MTALGLSKRQRQTLDFIAAYTHEYRASPSYDDIATALGMASKSGVVRLVTALETRGHITRLPGTARSLSVIGATQSTKVIEGLSADTSARLLAFCLARAEGVNEIINDAVSLFIDEAERDQQ